MMRTTTAILSLITDSAAGCWKSLEGQDLSDERPGDSNGDTQQGDSAAGETAFYVFEDRDQLMEILCEGDMDGIPGCAVDTNLVGTWAMTMGDRQYTNTYHPSGIYELRSMSADGSDAPGRLSEGGHWCVLENALFRFSQEDTRVAYRIDVVGNDLFLSSAQQMSGSGDEGTWSSIHAACWDITVEGVQERHREWDEYVYRIDGGKLTYTVLGEEGLQTPDTESESLVEGTVEKEGDKLIVTLTKGLTPVPSEFPPLAVGDRAACCFSHNNEVIECDFHISADQIDCQDLNLPYQRQQ